MQHTTVIHRYMNYPVITSLFYSHGNDFPRVLTFQLQRHWQSLIKHDLTRRGWKRGL